jgi:hypothetical protein
MIIKNIYGEVLLKCKKEKGKYNLVGADLWKANLTEANLWKADLSGANLWKADLSGADLMGADLRKADLSRADLSETDLSGANLSEADLRGANLSEADLRGANLSEANLIRADLSGADLRDANLSGTNLSEASLTGAVGLIKEIDWLEDHFDKSDEGYICYKSFGEHYDSPKNWIIEENSIIDEKALKMDRRVLCAPGINIATKEWCNENCGKQVWKCILKFEWMDEVCVPYGTDGKFRCSKLLILEKLCEDEVF